MTRKFKRTTDTDMLISELSATSKARANFRGKKRGRKGGLLAGPVYAEGYRWQLPRRRR